MATTPDGLWYPDPSTSYSIESIIQQAQLSVGTWVKTSAGRAAWATAPTMGSGWTLNTWSGTIGGGLTSFQFIASKATALANGDIPVTIPAGYRPKVEHGGTAWQGIGGANGACAFLVDATGALTLYGVTASNTQIRASLTYVSA